MTVRDLLSHTSGLTYGFMERTNVDAADRKLGVGDRTRSGYAARDMVEELAALAARILSRYALELFRIDGRGWTFD